MELTEDNFNVYAASHYDNPMCLSEDEFIKDLNQIKTIRRMMTRYMNGKESNVRLLINNIIIFYNCFEHHAATNMLQMLINDVHVEYFNAVLMFLSFPTLIPPNKYNVEFYKLLEVEFK
jgi:hypothetical protein